MQAAQAECDRDAATTHAAPTRGVVARPSSAAVDYTIWDARAAALLPSTGSAAAGFGSGFGSGSGSGTQPIAVHNIREELATVLAAAAIGDDDYEERDAARVAREQPVKLLRRLVSDESTRKEEARRRRREVAEWTALDDRVRAHMAVGGRLQTWIEDLDSAAREEGRERDAYANFFGLGGVNTKVALRGWAGRASRKIEDDEAAAKEAEALRMKEAKARARTELHEQWETRNSLLEGVETSGGRPGFDDLWREVMGD